MNLLKFFFITRLAKIKFQFVKGKIHLAHPAPGRFINEIPYSYLLVGACRSKTQDAKS